MPQTTIEWRRDAGEEELRERAAEMRSEWTELVQKGRDTDEFKRGKAEFLAEMEDIDVHLSLRSKAKAPEALRGVPRVPEGAIPAIGGDGAELRSAGAQVVESERYQQWVKDGGIRSGEFRHELRALVAEGDANGSGLLLPVGQPYLVDTRRRRLFIRDLIGVQQTGLSAIPYIREKNVTTTEGGAATVAEGAAKPQATIQFDPDNAPVQVIAVTLPVTTQIVEDAATLMGYINGRLPYMVKFREEAQILSGNGTTPNLKGILSYTDVQEQAFFTDMALTIGQSIAKIEVVDGFADGVAMNPIDFWNMMTHRVDQGGTAGGQLDAGAITQAPIQYVWGLPIVRTNSIAQGTALVGNYQLGATLFDRRSVEVRTFEQHGTFAEENKVLLRAEERLALAVNRPDFFVSADLTAA